MKSIFKMTFKCIAVLLPLWIIWSCAAFGFSGYADGEAPYYRWNHNYVNTSSDTVYDVVILGDSTSNSAYLPELLSDQTINLALGGTAPSENYYTLYNYLQTHSTPKVCYISYTDKYFKLEDCYWTRTVYSHLLSYTQAKEIYDKAVLYQDNSIVQTKEKDGEDGSQKLLEHYIWWPAHYMPAMMNAGIDGRAKSFESNYKNSELHRGVYITGSQYENGQIAETDYSTFEVSRLEDEYYKKTIELCEQYNIQVRIIKLPTSPSYRYTNEYITSYNAYYATLQAQYPDITVDWVKNGFDKFDFKDIFHMNFHGAMRFSLLVSQMYPEDFESNELNDTKISALLDYARKSPRLDDMLQFSHMMNHNTIIVTKNNINVDFTDYAKYAIKSEFKTGYQAILFNFAGREINCDTSDIDNGSLYFDDEAAGRIALRQTGQGIFTMEFPGSNAYTIIDGMQVDAGATTYFTTPLLSKEFYYRDNEFDMVVSK